MLGVTRLLQAGRCSDAEARAALEVKLHQHVVHRMLLDSELISKNPHDPKATTQVKRACRSIRFEHAEPNFAGATALRLRNRVFDQGLTDAGTPEIRVDREPVDLEHVTVAGKLRAPPEPHIPHRYVINLSNQNIVWARRRKEPVAAGCRRAYKPAPAPLVNADQVSVVREKGVAYCHRLEHAV